ncbi:MAG: sodium-translocating pyrophosphatase, partial [Planctomycetes bacterium]|nr:sodium-translocating pyrophosphatase [Planctomycetota bacterium]
MTTATYASNRTTAAATKSLNEGLQVAFRSGAVMGLIVVGLALIDISGWFAGLRWLAPRINPEWHYSLTEITVTMLCFGMGASLQALFARVGGGIFTKAADVGADLVGKVEAGIPEDDPRNPATIADNVGDNVGDVAGMGADLYESYCGSILATAALGVAAAHTGSTQVPPFNWVAAPMVIAGIGTIASVLGVLLVRTKENAGLKQLMRALNIGIWGSSALVVLGSVVVLHYLLPGHMGYFGSIVAGLAAGLIIGLATEYYTSHDYGPAREIAKQAKTGPATVVIRGIATGMLSTWVPVISVSIAMLVAYGFGGGFTDPSLGLYGVGIAAVGMLSTLGITLATDAYGPIADNAGGNAEMSGQEAMVRQRTDALDALGNTTAATGKGFAIGSAALTALALLAAYIEEVRNGMNFLAKNVDMDQLVARGVDGVPLKSGLIGRAVESVNAVTGEVTQTAAAFMHTADGLWVNVRDLSLSHFMEYYNITLMNPKVIIGMFIGAMMVMVFCALTLLAVGRAAGAMVEEVRRQFREISGLLEGKAGVEADYARCVEISTVGAQKEMMLPSLLAVIIPVLTGLLLGVAGVMGLLAGGLVCGFVVAVFMANAGGAWDNAKKYIETGELGGKGSDNHKACVVGDTIGDPFKDTSGPSLNILIKLMSMVSVVVAGLVVKYGPEISAWLHMGD